MKRLFKDGVITTILGILILIFAGTMLAMEKATSTEAIVRAGYGFIFLRSKDSLIGLAPKSELSGPPR